MNSESLGAVQRFLALLLWDAQGLRGRNFRQWGRSPLHWQLRHSGPRVAPWKARLHLPAGRDWHGDEWWVVLDSLNHLNPSFHALASWWKIHETPFHLLGTRVAWERQLRSYELRNNTETSQSKADLIAQHGESDPVSRHDRSLSSSNYSVTVGGKKEGPIPSWVKFTRGRNKETANTERAPAPVTRNALCSHPMLLYKELLLILKINSKKQPTASKKKQILEKACTLQYMIVWSFHPSWFPCLRDFTWLKMTSLGWFNSVGHGESSWHLLPKWILCCPMGPVWPRGPHFPFRRCPAPAGPGDLYGVCADHSAALLVGHGFPLLLAWACRLGAKELGKQEKMKMMVEFGEGSGFLVCFMVISAFGGLPKWGYLKGNPMKMDEHGWFWGTPIYGSLHFLTIFFLAVRSISAAAKEAAAAPSPLSLDPTDDGSAGRCKAGGVVWKGVANKNWCLKFSSVLNLYFLDLLGHIISSLHKPR